MGNQGGGVGENPWRTLRARPHLDLVWWIFDGAPTAQWRGGEILLDERLGRVERRCALMHELVHEERGIGWPDATAATMQREEETVRRATAIRLVPLGGLATFVARRSTVGAVTGEMVGEEYDVTRVVAIEAMRALARKEGRAA